MDKRSPGAENARITRKSPRKAIAFIVSLNRNHTNKYTLFPSPQFPVPNPQSLTPRTNKGLARIY